MCVFILIIMHMTTYGGHRNSALKQVSSYKYLVTWTTEDARNDADMKTRIAMIMQVFWKKQKIAEAED